MTNTQPQTGRCVVYRGSGESIGENYRPLDPPAPDSICGVMSRELICARSDLPIASVLGVMLRHHIGCLPIVDERRRPVGVITKLDLVEQIEAAMRCSGRGEAMPSDLVARTADDVMMPLALTLDTTATVAHAAAMMTSEDTHHVLVVDQSRTLVGIVSAKDIVRWVNHAR
jgi:CBS-domain-containing membrane protein